MAINRPGLCNRCRLRVDLCVCNMLAKLETRTRVVLLMHSLELKKASNTARLLTDVLRNSEMRLQGVMHQPLDLSGLSGPEHETLILFPDTSAAPLTPASAAELNKPVMLLVPDGTWGQAKKIAAHASMLPGARRVTVPTVNPSRYRLRIAEKENQLCTLEAVARALGALESRELQEALEGLLELWAQRSIEMRKRGHMR